MRCYWQKNLHCIIQILCIFLAAGACSLRNTEADIYRSAVSTRHQMDMTRSAIHIILKRIVYTKGDCVQRFLGTSSLKGLVCGSI